jgi:hypothetical protein
LLLGIELEAAVRADLGTAVRKLAFLIGNMNDIAIFPFLRYHSVDAQEYAFFDGDVLVQYCIILEEVTNDV